MYIFDDFCTDLYLSFLVVVVAISLIPLYDFEKAVPLVQTGETLIFVMVSHYQYHFGVYFDLINRAVACQYCACSNPRVVDKMKRVKEKIG